MSSNRFILILAMTIFILGSGTARKPTGVRTPVLSRVTPTVQAEEKGLLVATAENNPVARELVAAQETIGDLTADFTLIISGAGKDGSDFTAQGKMWLTTGRRYAIQYEQPERQRLISDGTKRWLYLEKINQVQIQSLPPAGNPNDFFLELGGGLPALIKQCEVKRFAVKKNLSGITGFELTPRAGTSLGFKRARLWLQGKHLLPVRVVVEAARQVRVEFRNVKIHTLQELLHDPEQGLPASIFTFSPPQDAEVIQMF